LETLFAATRALHFASLMTVFGASALMQQAGDLAIRRLLRAACIVALATAILWLGFVANEMTGEMPGPERLWNVVTASGYGHVFAVRFVLLMLLVALAFRPGRHGAKAVLAGAALAALGFTSHAAASGDASYRWLRALNDALHLLTAGFWLGGLAALTPEVLAKPMNGKRLAILLRRFSRYGTISVAILLVSGTLNGIAILDTAMRWAGGYVGWLAFKIVLAGLMVALALTNRFSVLPGLEAGEVQARETIPLTVAAELSFALAIVLIVGFLGLMPPMQM
jgi:putative copper resistance protein D